MFRGIFATPQTPYRDDGTIDNEALRREVDFCVEAGAAGLAALVMSAEFNLLSDDERKLVTRVIIEQVKGRIPVFIGTSGVSTEVAVEMSRFAEKNGADGVIAMPPYAQKATFVDVVDYFERIAGSVSVPVMIQNAPPPLGTPISTKVIKDLLKRNSTIQYVKEENVPAPHCIDSVVRDLGSDVKGVFGGTGGRWMVMEHQSGACGWIVACEFTDVLAGIFDLLEKGDVTAAREVLDSAAPLIDMELLYGVTGAKEFLRLRGILPNRLSRLAGAQSLTGIDEAEFAAQLERIRPLLKVK